MAVETKNDKVIIAVDPEDDVISFTLKFIARVIGEHFFEIVDGEKIVVGQQSSSEPRPITKDNRSCDLRSTQPKNCNCEPVEQSNSKPDVDELSLFRSWENLCHYPVLHLPCDRLICYAGLCTVVRQMVHYSNNTDPKLKAISLLGENETCLKSYSEVSNWTKFCESDLPRAAKSMQDKVKQNKNEKGGCSTDAELIPNDVQLILEQLELELKTAKNIKNKRKYHGAEKRKWILKSVQESFEGQYYANELLDEYVNNIIKDSSTMWSPYLTGFQITVADLITASIIFQILCKLSRLVDLNRIEREIPLVFRWLHQMLSVPVVKKSAPDSWIGILSVKETKMKGHDPHLPQPWGKLESIIEPVSQTKLEQKNSKIRVQHQNKIRSTLAEMEELGLSAEIFNSNFDCPHIDWGNLPLDLNPSKGDLNKNRALRKQKQIANLYAAVKSLAKPGQRIVDFCAGGGHVGIVLAYFLPSCEVILVENKEQSVSRAMTRILSLGMKNIRICHSNLDYFCGHFDIGVSLHACGVATDLVLNACLRERASFVVTPCCYGSIKNLETIKYPRSTIFQCKVCVESYMVLTHSADMTSWDENSVKNHLAKSSMALIDTDRCSYMQQFGYVTKLLTMVPANCTPKNHILIGELPS